ncbi:MAG: hypothetical protein WC908_03265 [Candidatus Paceibacterota bacterium]
MRSTQNIISHSLGVTFINKIPISINGIAKIANFFQILKTRSEKNTTNNNEAEIKRGVKTNIGINSSKNKVLQE